MTIFDFYLNMSRNSPYYHTIPACNRCRRRKTRCDTGRPFCAPCGKAGTSCEYVDPRTRSIVSREQITILESKLQELQLEYANKRGSNTSSPRSLSTRANADLITLGDVAGDAHFLGVSSGIHLARAVLESAQNNDTDLDPFTAEEASPELSNNDPPSGITTPKTLPDYEVALSLSQNFFSSCQFPYPILVKDEFIDQLAKTYAKYDDLHHHPLGQSSTLDKHFFMTNMVLAISLLSLANNKPRTLRLAEQYYNNAVANLTNIMREKDISSLQCILLFLLYSLKNSTRAPIWYISGLSMRMCIDLGFHSEKTIGGYTDVDTLASRIRSDTKRRLFWVAYSMDRTFSMILGRPFAFKDGSTDVQHPSISLPENQREQIIHWIHLQQLQSEIVSRLYLVKISECDKDTEDGATDSFMASMSIRLEEWKSRALELTGRNNHNIDWWNFWYYNSILLLTRPSPKHPNLNVTHMLSCQSAAISIIQISFVQLNLMNGPVSFTWSDIHHQIMAGITLLFTVWNSTEARAESKKELSLFKGYLAQWNNVMVRSMERWPRIDRAQQVLQKLAQRTVEVLEDEISGVRTRSQSRQSFYKETEARTSSLFFASTGTASTRNNRSSPRRFTSQGRNSSRSQWSGSDTMRSNQNHIVDRLAGVSSLQAELAPISELFQSNGKHYNDAFSNVSSGPDTYDRPENTSAPLNYQGDQALDFAAVFGRNPLGGWDISGMEIPFATPTHSFESGMDFFDLFNNAPGSEDGNGSVHAQAPLPVYGFQNSGTNLNYYNFNTASALNFQEP